jgi:hypothetical protein
MIRELFDIEEDRPGDMTGQIARTRIHRWRDTHGRKRGVKDHGAGIAQAVC